MAWRMAVLTIQNIDKAIRKRLRLRAAIHAHSMEDELDPRVMPSIAEQPMEARVPNYGGAVLFKQLALRLNRS
jgi:hypothetical protein